MIAPLIELSIIAHRNFFLDTEERRFDYFGIIGSTYDTYKEKVVDGEKGILFHDFDMSSSVFLKNSDLYIVKCYEELERSEMLSLKEKIYTVLDPTKTELYIRYTIQELTHIHDTIEGFELEEKLEASKVAIIAKLQNFITYIERSYLNIIPNTVGQKRIRWMADIKLLTTLFYDLMNGQDKTKRGATSTKSIISAKIVDIEKLIVDNFIDEKGQSLNPDTIHKYLKRGTSGNRVAEGGRIELELP